MHLVTFAIDEPDGRLGLLDGSRVLDLGAAAAVLGGATASVATMSGFLHGGGHAHELAASLRERATRTAEPAWWFDLDAVRLRPPVPHPPKILCLAGNYAAHIREGGGVAPAKTNTTPQPFIKPITTLIAHGESIRLPGPLCTAVDYEGELVAVIGRDCRDVPAARALDYVAGYACFNDVSGRKLTITAEREINARTGFFDWLSGKWFDTFGPLGPMLVTADAVPDPQALTLTTRVNGAVRQQAGTGDMIFTVAETIAWLSQFVTLQPGDLIATGTPSGVGSTTGTFLQAGDVVEVEITGLGTLRNPVTD
ncbi:MAG: fumarylacetoacetate hydrolase family protein [Chloroflexi bacterium]|nr:fumarylacetoacetate hydrolase family protein [Chloroflexota bacterium]